MNNKSNCPLFPLRLISYSLYNRYESKYLTYRKQNEAEFYFQSLLIISNNYALNNKILIKNDNKNKPHMNPRAPLNVPKTFLLGYCFYYIFLLQQRN